MCEYIVSKKKIISQPSNTGKETRNNDFDSNKFQSPIRKIWSSS